MLSPWACMAGEPINACAERRCVTVAGPPAMALAVSLCPRARGLPLIEASLPPAEPATGRTDSPSSADTALDSDSLETPTSAFCTDTLEISLIAFPGLPSVGWVPALPHDCGGSLSGSRGHAIGRMLTRGFSIT
jgi:hypothetical protein